MAPTDYSDTKFSTLSLFKGIDKKQLTPMLKCLGGHTKIIKKGTYLILAQEEVKYIGIVLSGCVHMIHEDVWGDKTILAFIKRDGLFGESFACGTDLTTCVTFQAAEETEVLLMPFRKVLHSCEKSCQFHQRLIENMATLLADKNAQLMKKLQITTKKVLRKKLLTYLSFQAQHAGSNTFTIPMNRTELADFVCADRTAVARELTHMKEEGLIDFDHNKFTLN